VATYGCILEIRELGCILGSDICPSAKGGGCLTTIVHNGSKEEVISDSQKKDRLAKCSVSSRCFLEPFCNSPPLSDQVLLQDLDLLQNQDKNTSVVLDFLNPIPSSRSPSPIFSKLSTSQTGWPSDYDP
ncbi:LOW QUALITY PROTEIN: lymphocyte antigen 6 complex locus protein G5c, partial [Sarcophilus harrisii]|uniref:LOW QUALITY PROTEIN: lymphocyte antigen 6 complex locus protein G5c n=1 Tax=Sarcophilus harrisii TaxID=9305 RepID=UPI001301F2E4